MINLATIISYLKLTLISFANIVQSFELCEYLIVGLRFDAKKYEATPSITREKH